MASESHRKWIRVFNFRFRNLCLKKTTFPMFLSYVLLKHNRQPVVALPLFHHLENSGTSSIPYDRSNVSVSSQASVKPISVRWACKCSGTCNERSSQIVCITPIVVSLISESLFTTIQIGDDCTTCIDEDIIFDEDLGSHSAVDCRGINVFEEIIPQMSCAESKRWISGVNVAETVMMKGYA